MSAARVRPTGAGRGRGKGKGWSGTRVGQARVHAGRRQRGRDARRERRRRPVAGEHGDRQRGHPRRRQHGSCVPALDLAPERGGVHLGLDGDHVGAVLLALFERAVASDEAVRPRLKRADRLALRGAGRWIGEVVDREVDHLADRIFERAPPCAGGVPPHNRGLPGRDAGVRIDRRIGDRRPHRRGGCRRRCRCLRLPRRPRRNDGGQDDRQHGRTRTEQP